MQLQLFQIDAFASEVFRGNPAAVCPLDEWLPDATMQQIAAENNLSETAFFVKEGDGYALRWFTPGCEVDLCGHATLATSYVIFNYLEQTAESIKFTSKSGLLEVTRAGELLVLDFPANPPAVIAAPEFLSEGLGCAPLEVWRAGDFIVALLAQESEVRQLTPDFALLRKVAGREVVATAPGDEVAFVSRMFAPKLEINEDPVTGAAHCVLTPFWAARLGQTKLYARQISARGGDLFCELAGERVKIGGRAVAYLRGTIEI